MKSEYIELAVGISKILDYRGKTPQKLGSDWVENGVRVVSAKNVHDGKLDNLDAIRCVTKDVYEKWMKEDIQRNDILLASEGASMGESMLWESDEKIVLGQRLFCLRCNTSILNPYYLAMYMRTSEYRAELVNHATGTSVLGLRQPALLKTKVRYLPIESQNIIGEMYRVILSRIDNNKKINDNLYEMVNAYYTSLFKENDCEMTTVGNYAERIYSGGTPMTSTAAYWNGTFGWFSSGETRNRFVISTEKTITQAGIDNSSTKLATKYDIVMASAGQGFTRGQTSMLLIDTYVNQSVIVIKSERNILPYLFWNLANRYDELRAISDSSSIRGSLTTKMIAAFEIPLAKAQSLQAFADFAWSVIPQIENNLLENERLTALRDSLLPKLMSGEIDVSDIQL